MRRHLRKCPQHAAALRRKRADQADQSSDQQLFNDFFNIGSTSSNRHEVMTHERLKEKVLRIIVSGNLPFAFVENTEFQGLCADAYPDCIPLPNRRSMRDYLKAKAEESKSQLKERLMNNDSKVNLVLDIWTTRSNLAFLGIPSHLVVGCLLFSFAGDCFPLLARYMTIFVTGYLIFLSKQSLFPLHYHRNANYQESLLTGSTRTFSFSMSYSHLIP